jgi:hypothetical protein
LQLRHVGAGLSVLGCGIEETFGNMGHLDPAAMVALWRRVDGRKAPGSWHRGGRRRWSATCKPSVRFSAGSIVRCGWCPARPLVDSSKYASYGLLLAGVPEFDLRVLHLVRDSRAVAYSWLREKLMPEISTEVSLMPIKRPWRSAVFWDLENLGLHLLRRLARGYQVLRYDDLTARPCAVLSAALERVGIAADLEFLRGGRLDLGVNHTVAGNPIRFLRGEVPIQPDAEWRTRLSPGARRLVTGLTWPLLVRYGFPLAARS